MTDIQSIYNELRRAGMTETGALAMMGNWKCESLLDPFRKQGDLSEAALPSHRYVEQVTNGQISALSFASDQAGFGLAQWTYWSPSKQEGRKLDLYNFWKRSGLPLDSAVMQTRFAVWELTSQGQYSKLWNYLCTASPDGLYNACDRICREYERPAYNNVQQRYNAAVELSAKLDLNDTAAPPASGSSGAPAGSAGSENPQNVSESDSATSGQPAPPQEPAAPEPDKPTTPFWPVRGALGGEADPGLCKGMVGCDVMLLQAGLTCRGHGCTVDGIFGSDTDAALRGFQTEQGLKADGICGPKTWNALLERR